MLSCATLAVDRPFLAANPPTASLFTTAYPSDLLACLARRLHMYHAMSHVERRREESRDPRPVPLVMIIDDDAEMRAVLRDFLTREGFQIHEEAGGEGVVVALESLHPAVIVLAKDVPGASGLDLLS